MNIRRYYNQNRKKIWGIVIIVASIFVLFQLINNAIQGNVDKKQTINNNETTDKISTESTQLKTNTSVISGEKKSNEDLKTATETIDSFMNYCNKKNLEKAYDMLTEECKKEMYSSLDIFKETYYKDVFNEESKDCNIENWLGNTYRVRIMSDSLSTGKSNDGYAKEDYITVKKVDKEYKLNINNYVRHKEMNKTTDKKNIKMEILSIDTYKDYEKYTIKVTNNTKSLIVLGDVNNPETLYLEDSKKVPYNFYNHEMTKSKLTIKNGQTKEITIKFYSGYVSNRNIKNIVFPKLSLYDGELSEEVEYKAEL